MELWREGLKEFEQILYIPMSSGLSGSCNTVKMLAASSADDKTTQEWLDEIHSAFPDMEILSDKLTMRLSCHIGEGGLGIGCSCRTRR